MEKILNSKFHLSLFNVFKYFNLDIIFSGMREATRFIIFNIGHSLNKKKICVQAHKFEIR